MVGILGEAVLPDSWLAIFGDVLNISRTSEKHYSALEFKVIGIVYIVGYSIVGTR
jgi:hypothetical protein